MSAYRINLFTHQSAVALLFGLAVSASLFFNGVRIEYFAVAMSLLLILLMTVFWYGCGPGLKIPKTPLAIALSLFWIWLAITLLWSPVPYVSMVNFWWVGSACFVFWLGTFSLQQEQVWKWTFALVLGVGFALGLFALHQMLVLNEDPRSTFLTHNSHAALLTLMAVPLAAYYLLTRNRAGSSGIRWLPRLMEIVLFTFFLAVAVTGSRGVALGMFFGIGFLATLAYRHVPRRNVFVLLGIIAAAFVVADILKGGFVAQRLGTIANPASAGYDRFIIWDRAWNMLQDSPWLGIGLGTFWLHWPPYRHPEDTSAGYYVHNDYLQIWIEAGLPGLLALLGIYIAVLALFVRFWRYSGISTDRRIESAGLVGGLLAIAVHTFFDFDFYIHPIQLVMGLVLARLHVLYLSFVPVKSIVVEPAQVASRRAYRTIGILLVLLPLFYFVALGTSAVLTNDAHRLARKGKWAEASTALSRAARLTPTSDMVLASHADLFRQAITQLPRDAAERAALYREALALLEDAERANPLRSQVFFIRALLYQQNTDLAGSGWATNAERAYGAALKLDPLAYRVREAYARFLFTQGRAQQAREVLEGGIAYWYPGKAVAGYYLLVAEVRRQQGDAEGAAALTRKASDLVGRPLSPPAPVPGRFPQQQHLK